MKNRIPLIAVLALALAGCTQIPYGWKQEMELVPRIPQSFARSFENENAIGPSDWVQGVRSELHTWHPWRGLTDGVRADWHRLTVP